MFYHTQLFRYQVEIEVSLLFLLDLQYGGRTIDLPLELILQNGHAKLCIESVATVFCET